MLDVAGDTLVAVALLAGIVRRLARSGPVPGWPVLGALGLGVAGAFAVDHVERGHGIAPPPRGALGEPACSTACSGR